MLSLPAFQKNYSGVTRTATPHLRRWRSNWGSTAVCLHVVPVADKAWRLNQSPQLLPNVNKWRNLTLASAVPGAARCICSVAWDLTQSRGQQDASLGAGRRPFQPAFMNVAASHRTVWCWGRPPCRDHHTLFCLLCHYLGGQGASGLCASLPYEKFRGFRPIKHTPIYVFIRTPLNRIKFPLDIFLPSFPMQIISYLQLFLCCFISVSFLPSFFLSFFLSSYCCNLLKFLTFGQKSCVK